jgi:hypothetical protein
VAEPLEVPKQRQALQECNDGRARPREVVKRERNTTGCSSRVAVESDGSRGQATAPAQSFLLCYRRRRECNPGPRTGFRRATHSSTSTRSCRGPTARPHRQLKLAPIVLKNAAALAVLRREVEAVVQVAILFLLMKRLDQKHLKPHESAVKLTISRYQGSTKCSVIWTN